MKFYKLQVLPFFCLLAFLPVIGSAELESNASPDTATLKKHDSSSSCERGPRGRRGHRGSTGETGPRGPVGPTGAPGATGATGSTGLSLGDNFVYAYQDQGTNLGAFSDVTFTDTPQIDGWTFTSPSSFICNQAGKYLVTYRVQIYNDVESGSAIRNSTRAVINALEVAGSQVSFFIDSSPGFESNFPLGTNFIADVTVGDALKLQWIGTDNAVFIGEGFGNVLTGASITITRIN